MSTIHNARCVLVGDVNVGKTCFLITATSNVYPAEYVPTSADSLQHDVELRDGRQVDVIFMDTGTDMITSRRSFCL